MDYTVCTHHNEQSYRYVCMEKFICKNYHLSHTSNRWFSTKGHNLANSSRGTHTHTLDGSDLTKINSYLQNIIKEEVAKDHGCKDIFNSLSDRSTDTDSTRLDEAGNGRTQARKENGTNP
jgi:hypothetical protein